MYQQYPRPKMNQTKQTHTYRDSGFFVLRSPLLPVSDLRAWSDGLEASQHVNDETELRLALKRDRAKLRQRLHTII